MAKYRGIDVSSAQGAIDWAKVKASGLVDFAMLRSSYGWQAEGTEQYDKQFRANVKGCEDNNIPFGIYHYSYCVVPENARREARYFLKAIEGVKPDYPVFFDIEDPTHRKLTKAQCSKIAADFCDEVEKAGYRVGIYSYRNFLVDKIDQSLLDEYDIWVAETGDKTLYSGAYTMWQYSWKGQVDGIRGNVDLDMCYTDYINKENPPTGGELAAGELLELAQEKAAELNETLKQLADVIQ